VILPDSQYPSTTQIAGRRRPPFALHRPQAQLKRRGCRVWIKPSSCLKPCSSGPFTQYHSLIKYNKQKIVCGLCGAGKIRDLLTDERCTHSILGVLHTTKVGSRAGPRVAPLKPGEGRTERGAADGRTQGKECRSKGGATGRGAKNRKTRRARRMKRSRCRKRRVFPWVAVQAACRCLFILFFFPCDDLGIG